MLTSRSILVLAVCAGASLIALAQDADAPPNRLRGWGPEQACGVPDTETAGDHPTAWASRSEDDSAEWIVLDYATEVIPSAVRVFESFNPGALVAVAIVDDQGREIEVWRGSEPVPPGAERAVTLIPLMTQTRTKRIKLEFDSPSVKGWNEIDAVGLHGADGSLQWATGAAASSTFARAEAPPAAAGAVPASPPQPIAEWSKHYRVAVDGLYEVWLDLRANQGTPAAAVVELAQEILALQSTGAGNGTVKTGFAGRWQSTFGPMTLTVEGERVTGVYRLGTIEGTLVDGRLEFSYHEDDVDGEGWFELASGEQAFEGRWRPEGSERWMPWKGARLTNVASRRWLVVLEAPWQAGLADVEYSFGGMLRAIFSHNPRVGVRQRFFTDARSFSAYCREMSLLPGPVYLVVATHADGDGLICQSGRITPDEVAESLAAVPNLRTVHFSACAVMKGDMADRIFAARPEVDALEGVSGYDVSVDWMSSALTEFTLIDLLLNRGLSPARAARALTRLVDFADAEVADGSPIPAAHFRFQPAPGTEK